MSSDPPFPERARYGCVNCGSTNHTTGDKGWCPVEQERAIEPLSDSELWDPGPLYRRCDDPDCAYLRSADPPRVHYHHLAVDHGEAKGDDSPVSAAEPRGPSVYQSVRPLHLADPGADRTLCGIRLRLSEAHPYTGTAWAWRYRERPHCQRCKEVAAAQAHHT